MVRHRRFVITEERPFRRERCKKIWLNGQEILDRLTSPGSQLASALCAAAPRKWNTVARAYPLVLIAAVHDIPTRNWSKPG